MKLSHIAFLSLGLASVLSACGEKSQAPQTRDRISIVGSSTVFPFASIVSERMASSGVNIPKVESTGTGGGIKIFCSGIGVSYADIANASRQMKKSEFETCKTNGVTEIAEFKIGYDGIVIANAKTGVSLNITRKDLFLAIAKEVPIDGKLVINPYKKWNEINPELPNIDIDVMGPPPTSGTRDAFAELVLEKGAEEIEFFKELKKSNSEEFKAKSTAVREDGKWRDMGENDNLIVQGLTSNKTSFGVFGYSFYEENKDRLKAASINNQAPEIEKITSGDYPASRSIYFYVKKQNMQLIPNIDKYIVEFISDKAIGTKGYLVAKGLIPLKPEELKEQIANTTALKSISSPEK